MNTKPQNPFLPCPPQKFAGRFDKKSELEEILDEARHRGQMVLISGARGSGKSSFLEWAKYEIQDKAGGLECPAVKREFLETTGMIVLTYRDLLTDLKGYQKFGWFKKMLDTPKVKKSIEAALDGIEKALPPLGGAEIGAAFTVAAAKKILPEQPAEYSQLFLSFRSVLRNLSVELTNTNRLLAILVDDVQFLSDSGFTLLKDLIQNPLPAIIFIAAFRLEAEKMVIYEKLRQELVRYNHTEICLGGMTVEEIKDLANKRFDLSISDETAQFLSRKIGDPLCLVTCFDLLQKHKKPPTLANVQNILPRAVNPAASIYLGLDTTWKSRTNSLCILHPPLSLSLIACMLEREDLVHLQDELNQNIVFRTREKEFYDFAHTSLREYCRDKLPEGEKIKLHSQAARCIERLKDNFPEGYVDFSLADHLFSGQEYKKALELNLKLGSTLYSLFDYTTALRLTEQAKICAEKTNERYTLGAALHQKGMILHDLGRFSASLDSYNQSLNIYKNLLDSDPSNIIFQSYVATTSNNIGNLFAEMGKRDEALSNYQTALKQYNNLLDSDPSNIIFQSDVAGTTNNIGILFAAMGKRDEALSSYQTALKQYNNLLDSDPSNIIYQSYVATTSNNSGILLAEMGKRDEALEYYKNALKTFEDVKDEESASIVKGNIAMLQAPAKAKKWWQFWKKR